MILLSLDPGKLCQPWCAWLDGVLAHAGLSVLHGPLRSRPEDLAAMHVANIRQRWPAFRADRVLVEQMQLTQGRDKTRGQAIAKGNDLLTITQIAAIVAGASGGALTYVPIGTWKGSAPKEVTRARVRATLTSPELLILESALRFVRPSLHHNLYDAAGIGLHGTGRYVVRRGHSVSS